MKTVHSQSNNIFKTKQNTINAHGPSVSTFTVFLETLKKISSTSKTNQHNAYTMHLGLRHLQCCSLLLNLGSFLIGPFQMWRQDTWKETPSLPTSLTRTNEQSTVFACEAQALTVPPLGDGPLDRVLYQAKEEMGQIQCKATELFLGGLSILWVKSFKIWVIWVQVYIVLEVFMPLGSARTTEN